MSLDASHWRERAKQARTVADWMDNEEAKCLLSEVAELYEKIAQIAETSPITTHHLV
jgi:hypothetical protein